MTLQVTPPIRVVGLGADGWPSLTARCRDLVLDAEVVLGGSRHLALLPPVEDQVRRPWPSPLREGLPAVLEEYAGRRVVALASGDPLLSGVASTLVELLGPEAVEIHPGVSSVALARAAMRWAAESVEVVSLVGRDPHLVLRALSPGRRVLALSADEHTPYRVAELLVGAGYGASTITVLGDLGTDAASRAGWRADEFPRGGHPRLHVLALELAGPTLGPVAGGLPDGAFEHDGQLTKRDLRASALARLAPHPGHLLWDVGAGAGSVGIEWLRADPACRAVAVEAQPDRADRVRRNAIRLGVPGLVVVRGCAPEALVDLPRPDAVFVGGGATAPGLLDHCLDALALGGRLVAHGVTLETERMLAEAYRAHGGELTRIQVEHAAPVGSFTGWTPARAVTQWAYRKESR